MTKDADFKQKVRARMSRTGERFSTARAHLLAAAPRPARGARHRAGGPDPAPGVSGSRTPGPTWAAIAGAHPETTALARLAAAAGVTVPGTGRPPSEAMVLGLGGGLGGAYFTFQYRGAPPTFYVATRCYPQYAYGAGFVTTAAARLGLALDVVETGSKAGAARQLAARVAAGPVLAWVDAAALPWSPYLPGGERGGAFPHVVVVAALDGDDAIVHDTAAAPHRLPAAALAAARARVPKEKHRLAVARAGAPPDPRAAIAEAIAACAAELAGRTRHKQMAGNFGVPGLAKWARLADAPKDPKGWPRLFPGGAALWLALTWGYHWIERAGTGGGGFRPLYAAFLDEAAAITGRRDLRDVARAYRELGAAWTDLARAMLPDGVPLLAATRAALDRGAPADGYAALRARADAGELDGDAAALRADVAARLRAIVERESEIAHRLAGG